MQVHIHQGDYEGTAVIVSWVTQDEPGDGKVLYGQAQGNYTTFVIGEAYSYSFYNYTSGFIHHAVISGLQVHSGTSSVQIRYLATELDISKKYSAVQFVEPIHNITCVLGPENDLEKMWKCLQYRKVMPVS